MSTLLTDHAAIWLESRLYDWSQVGYPDIKRDMLAYFSPSDYVFRARDELARCRQTGKDVKGYINAFRRCIVRIPQISEQEKIDRFLRGLSPALFERILPHIDYSGQVTFEAVAKFAER